MSQKKTNTLIKSFCPSCHWYSYSDKYDKCPNCGMEVEHENIPAWIINLDKAQGKQTGPKNTKRSSANAIKTLLHAKIHRWFPAKPGKYAECEECPYKDKCDPKGYCWYRNQMYNDVQTAFDSGDIEAIKKYIAQDNTKLFFIRNLVTKEILDKGALIPVYAVDNKGQFVLNEKGEKIIKGYDPNPLLQYFEKFMNIGNAKLEDWFMTPKSKKTKKPKTEMGK